MRALVLIILIFASTSQAANQCSALFERPTLRSRLMSYFARAPKPQAKYKTIGPRKGMRESDLNSRVSYVSPEMLPRQEIRLVPSTQVWSFTHQRPLIDGMYYYHMDAAGRFFVLPVADEHTVVRLQHSTLPAGGQTAGVGFVEFKNGKMISVDHYSGHYQPPPEIFAQVLRELAERGQDLSATVVGTY